MQYKKNLKEMEADNEGVVSQLKTLPQITQIITGIILESVSI